jgi:hypothetical protein
MTARSKSMAATSTRPKQSRSSGSTLGNSHRLAQRPRPSTTPAYYQGRPAWMWMTIFNRSRPHA